MVRNSSQDVVKREPSGTRNTLKRRAGFYGIKNVPVAEFTQSSFCRTSRVVSLTHAKAVPTTVTLPATAAIAGAKSSDSVYSAYPAPDAKPAAKLQNVCSAMRSCHPGLRRGGRGGDTPNKLPGDRAGIIGTAAARSSDDDVSALGRENTPMPVGAGRERI